MALATGPNDGEEEEGEEEEGGGGGAMGSTQPMTEVSSRDVSRRGAGGCCTGLTAFLLHMPIV